MKRTILSALCAIFYGILPLLAQTAKPDQPRLIIGIVVDQMRYDYLYRYQSKYTDGGFRRLMRQGFSCENTHFNYVPTYTGPGHASIYTGTTPAIHGIIGNNWFDRALNKEIYVTSDATRRPIGCASGAGQHSPVNLLTTTITDELRLSNNFRSKVVGICLKDRGSILPAGHIPNACYWFDDGTGNWVTSSFYPDSTGLPRWVEAFNAEQRPRKYLTGSWKTLIPESDYWESFADWNRFEKRLKGDKTGEFPHDLDRLRDSMGIGAIRYTPFGNSLTLDFALEAIEKMDLGRDEFPDFLCLSFSSTDYAGHQFGIHSTEVEDVYLRLDRDLERLMQFIDRKFGKNNVLVFLSADHGGAETPMHLKELRIPSGHLDEKMLEDSLEKYATRIFPGLSDVVDYVGNMQVYLNYSKLEKAGVDRELATALLAQYAKSFPGIYDAMPMSRLAILADGYPFGAQLRRGYHPQRGGDIQLATLPGWHPDTYSAKGGTTHGCVYSYDTHVPMLWYGWKIPSGKSVSPVDITDIAPTLSALLHITEPNGVTGKIISEIVK